MKNQNELGFSYPGSMGKAISSSDTNYQGRLEIKTLICATYGRRQTRWFIFLLRIFATLETAIQVKNFFFYKNPNTLFEQINNFFSLRFCFWLFFLPQNWPKIGFFCAQFYLIGSNFIHR